MRHPVCFMLFCFLSGLLGGNAAIAEPLEAGGAVPAAGVSLGALAQCDDGAKVHAGTGATLAMVRRDGSADRAGIHEGDVLHRLGGAEIHGYADLPPVLRSLHPGGRVTAVVRRDGKDLMLPIQFSDADAGPLTAAGRPCLPPMPYSILPLPDKVEGLGEHLQGETSISVSGDVLSIIHRDARSDVQIGGSLQMPMEHIRGTDLWLLRLKMPGWDRAFFYYLFVSPHPQAASTPESPPVGFFRGPLAPTLPVPEKLQGTVLRTSLHSTYLNEDRAVSVYLPPGAHQRPLPVLFMTDGQTCGAFALVLEPLMLHGAIRPFAIIGEEPPQGPPVRPGAPMPPDRRSQEYFPGVAPEVFERHMQFFTEELLPWATKTYRLSESRADRALFGFSNGGVFVLALVTRQPALFGAALPFSAGWTTLQVASHGGPLPRIFLAAGELEPEFLQAARHNYEVLREAGADVVIESYMSGHDQAMWQVALVHYMPGVFPPTKTNAGPGGF